MPIVLVLKTNDFHRIFHRMGIQSSKMKTKINKHGLRMKKLLSTIGILATTLPPPLSPLLTQKNGKKSNNKLTVKPFIFMLGVAAKRSTAISIGHAKSLNLATT